MWILIIILGIIIYYFISFNSTNNQQKEKLGKEGGIIIKYHYLIQYIFSLDKDMKILDKTDKSITIGVIRPTGYSDFHILQTFDKVYIRWSMKDRFMGNYHLSWNFNELMDQAKMAKEIQESLTLFNTKLSNKLSQ